MKRINFYLPEEQYDWINEQAEKQGVSAAEIIRRAITLLREVGYGYDPSRFTVSFAEDMTEEQILSALENAPLLYRLEKRTKESSEVLQQLSKRLEALEKKGT